jgi:hypothetical protein
MGGHPAAVKTCLWVKYDAHICRYLNMLFKLCHVYKYNRLVGYYLMKLYFLYVVYTHIEESTNVGSVH